MRILKCKKKKETEKEHCYLLINCDHHHCYYYYYYQFCYFSFNVKQSIFCSYNKQITTKYAISSIFHSFFSLAEQKKNNEQNDRIVFLQMAY